MAATHDTEELDMHRRVWRISLVMAAAAISLAPAAQAHASAPTLNAGVAAGWAYLPTATGTPLASGVLSSAGGPSSGATIVLSAEPTDGTDAVALSRSTSGAGGAWSVGVPAGLDLTPYADKVSGMVNFMIETFDGTSSGAYFLSAKVTRSLTAYRAQVPDARSAGSATLAGQPVTLATEPTRSAGVSVEAQPIGATTAGPSPTTACCNYCSDATVGNYYNIKTWIGATFDEAGDGSAVHFYHSSGSSSSLGVGVSVSGSYGTFSTSGTSSKSSTVSGSYPLFSNVSYRDYYGYTNYEKVKRSCFIGGRWSYEYYMKPTGWAGGYTYAARGWTGMGYCTPVSRGVTVTKNSSSAYESTSGVSISGIIGINLSSQTGYSTSTEINFAMGSYGHPWCGRAGYPAGAPQRLTIHASRL